MNHSFNSMIDQNAIRFIESSGRLSCTLTFAQSLDAKISGPGKTPLIISGPESFRVTHHLRRMHDIILIGVGTAISDDPGLNARDEHGNAYHITEQPIPVILDPRGRLSLTSDSKLMRNYARGAGRRPVQLVHESRRNRITTLADVIYMPSDSSSNSGSGSFYFHWPNVFKAVEELGKTIMIEGGAAIIQSVLEHKAADLIVVTVAPVFIGPGSSASLKAPIELSDKRTEIFGKDVVFSARIG